MTLTSIVRAERAKLLSLPCPQDAKLDIRTFTDFLNMASVDNLFEGADGWAEAARQSVPSLGHDPVVIPDRCSVTIHLGIGLHHGSPDNGVGCTIHDYKTKTLYSWRKRSRALDFQGPVTAGKLLTAIGDTVCFEGYRNEVLRQWLIDSQLHTVDGRGPDLPTPNAELSARYKWDIATDLRSMTADLLDPAPLPDPTEGLELDALMTMAGGSILCGGTTVFVGLRPGAPCAGGASRGVASQKEAWTAEWSQPFA